MSFKQTSVALVGGGLVYVALAARVGSPGPWTISAALTDPVRAAQADVSGTRLKSKHISGADGSRLVQPDVLFDSQLGVDCSFRRAADGALRCLPADLGGGSWSGAFFSDAACTTGVTFVDVPDPGCTASVPTHVSRFTDPPYCSVVRDDRDLYAHVSPVGAVIAPVSVFYRVDGQGVCGPASSAPQNTITYSLGAELSASTFAAGTPGTDP